MQIPLPRPVNSAVIGLFARLAKIDTSEGERPLSRYMSVGSYFARRLKDGARPIASGELVAPADAMCRGGALVRNLTTLTIKSQSYTIEELVKDSTRAERLADGYALHFYLSPKDYHRVHANNEIEEVIAKASFLGLKVGSVLQKGICKV